MDYSFDVTRVLREAVTVWDKRELLQATKDNATRLRDIIDKIGASSSKAQGLGTPVTSYNILLQCPEQRLYLFLEEKKVVGMIKIGTKKLFIRNELDIHREITPMCVLDFYVHESKQRTGRGKMLFEAMLERERLQPWQLGYDRPSPKFINFLRKYYDLSNFIPQANNYVVFKRYFDDVGKGNQSRNEQTNASVSMRPLTAHKRSNSFDGGSRQPPVQTPSYYTPQKPQSRPETVTPLSLSQLNNHNPFSKQNPPRPAPSNNAPSAYSNPSQRGVSPKPYPPSPQQDSYYNNNNDVDDYHNESNYNQHDLNGSDERYNQYNDDVQSNHYDDNLSPEDYTNTKQNNTTTNLAFSTTTSGSYGSHAKRAPSPGPQSRRSPSPGPQSRMMTATGPLHSSAGYNKSHFVPTNNISTGHFALGGSELNNNYGDTPPIRGRSPARQRSESPFADTANLSPASSTRGRSQSVERERSHTAPKGLGTLGSFNQSFTQPLKYEKELSDPPQRPNTYKDSSMFPAKRDPHQARSPAYRLSSSSNINSREMDRLEDSMRNALSTIDNSEQRLNLIETGGYRAISPEPRRAPAQGDHLQMAQARSIFAPVQPTGSPPIQRPSSPAKFAASREEENFSKSDYHKRFHNENPALMSSPPHNVRVHPNSRSRQSINY